MSSLVNSIQSILGKLWTNTANGFNKILPPDKRAELLSKFQDFANSNPKLAVSPLLFFPFRIPHCFIAFLATHVFLTGIPILLFTLFSISVLVFSLVTALLASILAALFFTFFMVGVALLFLVPTLFLTTFTASFVFLWGLVGFYVLKWFTQGEGNASDGKSVSEKVDRFTGGRAKRVTSGVSEKQELTHIGDDKEVRAHADDHDESDGTATERELEKVTESLRDDITHQSNRSPVKILKIVEGDENAADREIPAVPTAKETVGEAAET
ncbi:hypothetical protein P171DRAFT_410124 [Karstenula rhodostoma CBS 690.94]|uniref:Uncharacterized protein n=1 Tax=Karstenula rhodostoma CBS 690.94 TaxID=1392251 RepID=A0A9P4PLG3_9PLEO|nr:hypothetical protein P171DRAFT_410124 [Karstenula rhodostoma CBS 690.94]